MPKASTERKWPTSRLRKVTGDRLEKSIGKILRAAQQQSDDPEVRKAKPTDESVIAGVAKAVAKALDGPVIKAYRDAAGSSNVKVPSQTEIVDRALSISPPEKPKV